MTRLLTLSAAALALTLTACSSSSPVLGEASGVPGSAPYVVSDCAKAVAGAEANAAPGSGVTNGPVTVVLDGEAAPVVAIAADAPPASELVTQDLQTGRGPVVATGDTVTVQYCGIGLTTRKLFDSSWTRGQPAQFSLDGVIPGFQQGLQGMQAGGARLLVIPGELAYGANPPPGIEPNETLVFIVKVESIDAAP